MDFVEIEKLEKMRSVGKIVAEILQVLKSETKPGMTGKGLEEKALQLMKKRKVKSSIKGYQGFRAAICVSLNEELTHGIPDEREFKKGDLVSFDVACHKKNKKGISFHADAAMTVLIKADDEKDEEKQDLLSVTENALQEAIKNIQPGLTTNQDIGGWIEKYVREYTHPQRYYVIKEYGGHGIGWFMHEKPFIPNYRDPAKPSLVIQKNMAICIEPLVQIKNGEIKLDSNDN
jgi:methionyl aminopeptidase